MKEIIEKIPPEERLRHLLDYVIEINDPSGVLEELKREDPELVRSLQVSTVENWALNLDEADYLNLHGQLEEWKKKKG